LLVGSSSGCARLGADQFAIGLAMHDDAALQRMNLLAAELRQGVMVDGVQLSVEFRSGIAEWQPQVSVDDFIRQAGVALVEAKERGTHAVVFQPAHDIEHRRRITLVAELRRAIANGGLSLAYQPLVQMTNREAVMLEALVRWRHPTLGDVSPAEFIPLAERASVIADLSRWLMDAAIGQLGRWRRAGLNIDLAINLSASDMSDSGLPVRVLTLLQQHQVPATQLLLEVTESTIMKEPVLAAQVMTQLRSAGVRFAVDDFGTGHSSLAQLHSLPVDELKIDRAFIMNLDRTSSDQAIVRSTIELGHILGLRVVAEGVETPEVWSVLVRLGCDLAQGYFISRPMPADVVPGWMSTQRARLSHALTAAESDGTVATLRPRITERSVS
jgi:EAL domain-containing protein (putative c-di-GMP-specific phosphodiesterase class I)